MWWRKLSKAKGYAYRMWIAEYLYYSQVAFDGRVTEQPRDPHGLMLVPDGAKEPTVFQRKFPLDYLDHCARLG